jgi:hypothetical protein
MDDLDDALEDTMSGEGCPNPRVYHPIDDTRNQGERPSANS